MMGRFSNFRFGAPVLNLKTSRRDFIVMSGAVALEAATGHAQKSDRRLYAFVSSWTNGPNGSGDGGGIHVFACDENDGSLRSLSSVAPELNAGYICISPDGKHLYSTDERKDAGGQPGAGGAVVSFEIDRRTTALNRLNTVPSMGAFPAYISIAPDGSCIAVANHGSYDATTQLVHEGDGFQVRRLYDDATVSLFPVGKEQLLPASDIAVFAQQHAKGWERESGLDAVFQASPHAHSVNFDPSGIHLLACDKGADRIYVYLLEENGPRLKQLSVLETPSGTAPRHSAFHPSRPYVFIINELMASLSTYRLTPSGTLEFLQTVPTVSGNTVPAGKRNMPSDLHVHPSGRFVYGSTRGDNSIASFNVDPETGRLTALEIVSTLGSTPRGFNLSPDGKYLLVGNQESNEVRTFRVDLDTGRLQPTGARVVIPRPVCIKFAYL
jgi:6-phosphogluconolactonase